MLYRIVNNLIKEKVFRFYLLSSYSFTEPPVNQLLMKSKSIYQNLKEKPNNTKSMNLMTSLIAKCL